MPLLSLLNILIPSWHLQHYDSCALAVRVQVCKPLPHRSFVWCLPVMPVHRVSLNGHWSSQLKTKLCRGARALTSIWNTGLEFCSTQLLFRGLGQTSYLSSTPHTYFPQWAGGPYLALSTSWTEAEWSCGSCKAPQVCRMWLWEPWGSIFIAVFSTMQAHRWSS